MGISSASVLISYYGKERQVHPGVGAIVFRRSNFPEGEGRLPQPNKKRRFRNVLVENLRENITFDFSTRTLVVVQKTSAEKRWHPTLCEFNALYGKEPKRQIDI